MIFTKCAARCHHFRWLQSVEPMTDLALIAEASQKLTSLLDQVLAYVDDVLADRRAPDNAVGRALLDMVHSVPTMTPEQFEHMFNSNIKVGVFFTVEV
jgi:translation initiation factor 3 subunit F